MSPSRQPRHSLPVRAVRSVLTSVSVRSARLTLAAIAGLLTLSTVGVFAQPPEKATNLKVLPAEISHEELISVMRTFCSALGVRCDHCHARSEANPREPFDWASDAKPEKTTARIMMQLVHSLNTTEIPKITTQHPDRVQIECRTCHHGQARPFLIEDLLTTAYKSGGLDSLTAKYQSLRKEWYGTDSYDFGVAMLPDLGARLGGEDAKLAIALAEYNLKQFPESGAAYLGLGQAYMAAGDAEKATAALNKAAEVDPTLQQAVQRMLGRMQHGK